MYKVLLYYNFTHLEDPREVVANHTEVCKALQLKGRILINEQGVNGTVGGKPHMIEKYKEYMDKHEQFAGTDFKISQANNNPFPKLSVKQRKELVTTEAKSDIDLCQRVQHIKPKTLHLWLQQEQDNLTLLDMRNDYEWRIGRLKDAVRPPMKYFRDLKDHIGFYEQFKGDKIVLFCTGGIRCEPASALLVEHGFDPDNLYQLEGGIMKYVDKYGSDGFYIGDCFVFDDRVSIEVDGEVLSECDICGEESKQYRNCRNKYCNKLFIGCDSCMHEMDNTCSKKCSRYIQNSDNKRPKSPNHLEINHRNKGIANFLE